MPEIAERWYEFTQRRYYATAGTWQWRLWFELTGQGRDARRYARATKPSWPKGWKP